MKNRLLCLAAVLGLTLPAPAPAAIVVEFVPASLWGLPDQEIGLGGGTVEDFEDHTLAAGLAIEIADAQGQLTGIGSPTLPNLFDPVLGDPYGDSFALSVWDGTRVLVNTPTNQSIDYGAPDWRPVGIYVPGGADWIAVASQQVTINHTLRVNGQAVGRLAGLGFNLNSGRNGVMIVRSDDPTAPVFSLSFGGGGDAFCIDHVVFQPTGSLAAQPASWDGVKALYR